MLFHFFSCSELHLPQGKGAELHSLTWADDVTSQSCSPSLVLRVLFFPTIFFFFDVDHFFKVIIEIVTIFLLFYVLFLWPRGIWDLSSLTRDWIHIPFVVRQSLNPWTTREVPIVVRVLVYKKRVLDLVNPEVRFLLVFYISFTLLSQKSAWAS